MKNLLYLLFVLPLLFSCGGEEECKWEKYIEVSSDREFEEWFIDNYYGKQVSDFKAKYGPNDRVFDGQLIYDWIVKMTDGAGITIYYDVWVSYNKDKGEISNMKLMEDHNESRRKCLD